MKKLLIILIIASSYFLVNSFIGNGNQKFRALKSLINNEHRQLIKKYIFPHKLISEQLQKQEQKVLRLQTQVYQLQKNVDSVPHNLELKFIKTGKNIETIDSNFELSNNKILKKYKLLNGFLAGIHNAFPGSGYLDFYQNNLFILSSRGILGYTNNLSDKIIFKQIKNNINEYMNFEQFKKSKWYSLKDMFIYKDKVFISYTEEIKEDCWNTSIIYGDINFENIKFEKLFSPKECIDRENNVDKEFNAHQSGGRIISFDDNHILLTIGDYRNRYLVQDKESVNGKIIKININDANYEIISMGHRNPQGLYFDKENNLILETEHGPMGGDEINIIEVDDINRDKILNYGWPIVSAGEHYGKKYLEKKYEKYPLYKSHSKYGFIEPLKSFVPSIGISEITKIRENKYVVSSLPDRSLYFFELDSEKKIIDLERVEVFERVRDLKFNNNKLYLFLEDTASIGVIDLN
jgi:hypothetical protein